MKYAIYIGGFVLFGILFPAIAFAIIASLILLVGSKIK